MGKVTKPAPALQWEDCKRAWRSQAMRWALLKAEVLSAHQHDHSLPAAPKQDEGKGCFCLGGNIPCQTSVKAQASSYYS